MLKIKEDKMQELNYKNKITDLEQENQQLKQQLTEKEKEIENLNNRILISQLQAPEEQILKIIGSSCCQYKPNQDKISFAVGQLEKVKEFCEKELKECDKLLKTEFEDDFYIQSVMARESMCFDFRRTIDSQIKQLKGKK